MSEHETGSTRICAYHLGGNPADENSAYGYLPGFAREPNSCTHEGWTDERCETLRVLWAEGLSAGQIAKQLKGVTRNAVIGKVCRMGLPKRGRASAPARVEKVSPSKPRIMARSVSDPSVVIPFPEPEPELTIKCAPRVWTERGSGCTWIVAERGADSLACCNKVVRRGWCAEHLAMGTDPSGSTGRGLARNLRRYL